MPTYYFLILFNLSSLINGQPRQPETCMHIDIAATVKVQTVQNCENNSPALSGNCCSCLANPKAPTQCITEGCIVSSCPHKPITFVGVDGQVPAIEIATTNTPSTHSSESDEDNIVADDDHNDLDDDNMSDDTEHNSNSDSDTNSIIDDDYSDSHSEDDEHEHESIEMLNQDDADAQHTGGEYDAREKTTFAFGKSKAFDEALFGAIGALIVVIMCCSVFFGYKRIMQIQNPTLRKLSMEIEQNVSIEMVETLHVETTQNVNAEAQANNSTDVSPMLS